MSGQRFGGACCTTPGALCYWGAAFLLLYGAGLAAGAVWPAAGAYEQTLMLGALGGACLVNFERNRTFHCGITGPLFLVGALVAALGESGARAVNFALLWGLVLSGVGLALLLEWRMVGRRRAD